MIEKDIIPLRFGYFEEFSDPTLMFFGDCNSLKILLDTLLSLPLRKFIRMDTDPLFEPINIESFSLYLVSASNGLRYETDCLCSRFRWQLSGNQAVYLAERVKTVIDANHPCHDYLDTEDLDDVIILVSKDEYPVYWPDRKRGGHKHSIY
jgi:hypothetical protein